MNVIIYIAGVFAIVWTLISGATSIYTGKPFSQCLVSTKMSCEVD